MFAVGPPFGAAGRGADVGEPMFQSRNPGRFFHMASAEKFALLGVALDLAEVQTDRRVRVVSLQHLSAASLASHP